MIPEDCNELGIKRRLNYWRLKNKYNKYFIYFIACDLATEFTCIYAQSWKIIENCGENAVFYFYQKKHSLEFIFM